jgi:hypothetical protein
MAASTMGMKYDKLLNRESAQEILAKRAEEAAQQSAEAGVTGNDEDLWKIDKPLKQARRYNPEIQIKDSTASRRSGSSSRSSRSDSIAEVFGKSLARQLGSKSGQALVRGVLGSLFRGR